MFRRLILVSLCALCACATNKPSEKQVKHVKHAVRANSLQLTQVQAIHLDSDGIWRKKGLPFDRPDSFRTAYILVFKHGK